MHSTRKANAYEGVKGVPDLPPMNGLWIKDILVIPWVLQWKQDSLRESRKIFCMKLPTKTSKVPCLIVQQYRRIQTGIFESTQHRHNSTLKALVKLPLPSRGGMLSQTWVPLKNHHRWNWKAIHVILTKVNAFLTKHVNTLPQVCSESKIIAAIWG